MNEELKDFVLKAQDEHTKNLGLFKLFERIRYFGKNVFIMGGVDDPDDSDETGPIEKIGHVALLIACLVWIGGKHWIIKALIVYVVIHILLERLGKFFVSTYKEKLSAMAVECQKRLNDFCQEQYQRYEIVWGNECDEIRFDDFTIKNGYFEADLRTGCEPIHIYCLQDKMASEKYKSERMLQNQNGNKLYVDMKKDIASTEFNRKFGVLTPPDKEHACMKFLSPSCQISMIQAAGFDVVRELHIWNGKLHVIMTQAFRRPDANIAIYEENVIVNTFGSVDYYCSQIRRQADLAHECYINLKAAADV